MLIVKIVILVVGALIAGVIIGSVWVRRLRRLTGVTDKPAGSGGPTSVNPHPTPPPSPAAVQVIWSVTLLLELEWHRFEQVVVAYEQELGHVVRLRALVARQGCAAGVAGAEGEAITRLIQCKGARDEMVEPALVQELYDAMGLEQIVEGSFYTTAEFTAAAVAFASDKNIDLIDGRELLIRIAELPSDAQRRLYELAVAPEHKVPTCPVCGGKMTLREPGQRPKFWACLNTPDCNQTVEPKRR